MAAQLRASGSHPQWQNYQQGSTRQKRKGAFCEVEQQSFPPFASRARWSRSSPFDKGGSYLWPNAYKPLEKILSPRAAIR
jgi:hypothetical protein